MCDGWQEGEWMDRTNTRGFITGTDEDTGNDLNKLMRTDSRKFDSMYGAGRWTKTLGWDDNWGGTNWMKRLGMDPSVFDSQGGSSDSSSVNDISTIFDQSTGGSGGKNRKAKIASNKGTNVGKKKLTIKPSYA